MKLSNYAKKLGISYRTAWEHYKKGDVKGYQLPSGTIIVEEDKQIFLPQQVAIYARVSTNKQKDDLERQTNRLIDYSAAKGYIIYKVVKEIGSGLNDNRTKLKELLCDKNYNIIVIENKDRLTRFGFNYINLLMQEQNKNIEVINISDNDKEDIVQDLVSIITSFCARIYGNRRLKNKTEEFIKTLQEDDDAIS